MFYKSHKKSAARAFDHLYDPLYVAANFRDIQKANALALVHTAPVNTYTNFNAMFSDSPQRARSFFVLQQNPLPRLPAFNRSTKTKCSSSSEIGRNRAKFFNIPIGNAKPALYQSNDRLYEHRTFENSKSNDQTVREKPRSVGCQTIYREQSAQTKPYMPQIHHRVGVEASELFQMADLVSGGMIPGVYAAKFIQHQRKRRQWQRTSIHDKNISTDEKHLIAEAFEWKEWLDRETDFEEMDSMRLQLVEKMLKTRFQQMLSKSVITTDGLIDRMTTGHERQLEKIQKKYERIMRQLQKVCEKNEEQIKLGSPKLSELITAVHRGHPSTFEKYKSDFVANLMDVERSCFDSMNLKRFTERKSRIDAPQRTVDEIYPGFRTDHNLRFIYESMKAHRLKQFIHDEIARLLKLIDKLRIAPENINRNQVKVTKIKQSISELLLILTKLKEIINTSKDHTIEAVVILLGHEFNAISTNAHELNYSTISETNFYQSHQEFDASNQRENYDFTSVYLENVLQRCNELKSDNLCHSTDRSKSKDTTIDDLISNYVWPEIFERINVYRQNRKKLKVDLKKLTSEEELMVEDVGCECVDLILENLIKRKQ